MYILQESATGRADRTRLALNAINVTIRATLQDTVHVKVAVGSQGDAHQTYRNIQKKVELKHNIMSITSRRIFQRKRKGSTTIRISTFSGRRYSVPGRNTGQCSFQTWSGQCCIPYNCRRNSASLRWTRNWRQCESQSQRWLQLRRGNIDQTIDHGRLRTISQCEVLHLWHVGYSWHEYYNGYRDISTS